MKFVKTSHLISIIPKYIRNLATDVESLLEFCVTKYKSAVPWNVAGNFELIGSYQQCTCVSLSINESFVNFQFHLAYN